MSRRLRFDRTGETSSVLTLDDPAYRGQPHYGESFLRIHDRLVLGFRGPSSGAAPPAGCWITIAGRTRSPPREAGTVLIGDEPAYCSMNGSSLQFSFTQRVISLTLTPSSPKNSKANA